MNEASAVRRATVDDAEAIADAHVRGWQVAYRGLVPDAILDRFDVARRAAWWREELTAEPSASPPVWTWVVEGSDGVVGFARASAARDEGVAPPPRAGEVQAIYLRPERRGEGYGRALFATAVTHLERAGFGPLVVWVFEANAPTRRFYEAAGFQADGARHSIDFDGMSIPEIRYRRSSARPDPS